MIWRLSIVLPALLAGYVFLFLTQEQHISIVKQDISPALPTRVFEVLGHSYLKQLIAESLFIKTSVYYGGLTKQMGEDNLEIMGQHFIAMSQLHPKLLDIYYRTESALAHRGNAYVTTANLVMERGRTALPDEIAPSFFEGFNYFHYLQKPIKAAEILRDAANIPHAPRWIGHLASMLMASGGNIRTGLVWLKGMYATTQDEDEKSRYGKDIVAFEKGMKVQLALARYVRKLGQYPTSLTALLPVYLDSLPVWENGYHLEYQPPKLFLRRQANRRKAYKK